MLWLILLFNNRKGSEKYNKRYMKTWRPLVLVMRAHETKTKYTILSINTCKIFFQPLDVEEPNIFNGSILSKSPSQSLGCLMSENAPSPLLPLKTDSWSCHGVRSQGKESRHSQVVCSQTQSIVKVNFAIRWASPLPVVYINKKIR